MRSEWWRAILALLTATAAAVVLAAPYARLVLPFHRAVVATLGQTGGWEVLDAGVHGDGLGGGGTLGLSAALRGRVPTEPPAARVDVAVQVASLMIAPVVFWTLLLFWRAAPGERLRRLAVGLGLAGALEALTTTLALLAPLIQSRALLDDQGTRGAMLLTLWAGFLEAGGRAALACFAALLGIALSRMRTAVTRDH
jgi:hypothetical protein